jgi:broad specificity phosphatase PhoE
MANRILFLVRHGETAFNAERRFQGHLDVPLNAKGMQQAERMAQVLARSFGSQDPARTLRLQSVRSSDLTRAIQTAEAIVEALRASGSPLGANDVRTDPRLREFHVGDLQGLTWSEYEQTNPEEAQAYLDSSQTAPHTTPYPGPGGECPVDVQRRVGAALLAEGIHSAGSRVQPCCLPLPAWKEHQMWRNTPANIWVCHGGTIRMILDLLGIERAPHTHIGNTDVLIVAKCTACGNSSLLAHIKGG